MRYDEGYKGLLGQIRMMADFIRGFFDPELVASLDLRTLQPFPVGRITEALRRRENDLVWRVQRKGRKGRAGEWLYVYVMLEIQSTVDQVMAVRIMAYMGHFYQDLMRSQDWKPNQKLPPVVAVVLYNGRKPWQAKLDIAELIESVGPALAPYIPKVVYRVVDIWQCPALGELNLADATFRLDRSEGPAETVRAGVTAMREPTALSELVDWLLDCDSADAFLARLKRA